MEKADGCLVFLAICCALLRPHALLSSEAISLALQQVCVSRVRYMCLSKQFDDITVSDNPIGRAAGLQTTVRVLSAPMKDSTAHSA